MYHMIFVFFIDSSEIGQKHFLNELFNLNLKITLLVLSPLFYE